MGQVVGAPGGGGFEDDGEDGQSGTGGKAGTLTSIGIGGIGGVVAGNGGVGFGGGAGGGGTGGGGGGGYKGGNGGIDGALGGLGGDSYVTTDFGSDVLSAISGSTGGSTKDNGSVVIKCLFKLGGPLAILLDEKTDPTCFESNDGEIIVNGEGGIPPYQFSIDGSTFSSNNIFSNLAGGLYTLTVMDDQGDTDDMEVTLEEPEELVGTTILIEDNNCPDGNEGIIEVVGSGGTSTSDEYLYSLDGLPVQSTGLFTGLTNGEYTITIYDDNNCTVDIVEEIQSPFAIEVSIESKTNITCFGYADGSITAKAINGTPPYSYSLDNVTYQNESTFDNLSAGNYTIYAKDDTDCVSQTNTDILEPSKLELVVDSINAGCLNQDNGTIMVHAIGGTQAYSYVLNSIDTSATGLFTGLPSGTHIIEVLDTNQCSDLDTIELIILDTVKLNIISTSDISCYGNNDGSIDVQGSGGNNPYQYILNGSDTSTTGQFDTLIADTYIIEVLDQNGCNAFDTIILSEPDSLYFNIINVDHESCFGANDGIINIEATGGTPPYNYIMNDTTFSSTGLFENLSPADYIIKYTDSNSCSYGVGFTINEGSNIVVSLIELNNNTCFGDDNGSFSLSIDGGKPYYTVIFNGDTSTISGGDIFNEDSLYADTYNYIIEDKNGCIYEDSIIITQNNEIIGSADNIQNADCLAGTLGAVNLNAIGGITPFSFILNGDTSTTGIFTNLSASNYMAIVTDSVGCSKEIPFVIEQTGGIDIDTIITNDVSCFGLNDGSISIIPNDTLKTYTYTLGSTSNTTGIFESLEPYNYTISITDDQNCEVIINAIITEPTELTLSVVDTVSSSGNGNGSITVKAEGGTPPYKYTIDNGESFQDNPIFNHLGNGSYMIIVEDANRCTKVITQILSITWDVDFNKNITIYPIPASNKINVDLNKSTEKFISYQIFNTEGKMMKVNMEKTSANNFIINTSEYNKGLYFLVLRFKDHSFGKRFLIIK